HATDITDEDQVAAALAAAGRDRVHACVNIAGVYPPSVLRTFTVDQYRRTFDINVLGALLTSRVALPYLERAGGGVIVTVASIGAFTAGAERILYKASKAAVVALTRSMATDLAPDVRVVGVAPGVV